MLSSRTRNNSASINPEIGYIRNSISAAYDVGFISDQEEAGMFLAGEREQPHAA
jgi:hypothetical protein